MIPANRSPALAHLFESYTRTYLRRNFHTLHLWGECPDFDNLAPLPLLVCVSHSSWWDVLLGLYVASSLVGWESYGVMDARQLRRYRFFTRLGMIGVDRTGLAGARAFLTYGERLLRNQRRALYLTPQGEMVSAHQRPIRFQPGLGYLAARLGAFHVVTLTLHYEFWDERRPEAFVAFSPVTHVSTSGPGFQRKRFLREQECRMETQLDSLLAAAAQRDPGLFQPLLHGQAGISPIYDAVRGLAARLRGERFSAEHSAVQSPRWTNQKPPEPQRHRDTEIAQSRSKQEE